jgi:hypothetical protein
MRIGRSGVDERIVALLHHRGSSDPGVETVQTGASAVAGTVQTAQTQVVAAFGPPVATMTAASLVRITSATISQADSTIVVSNTSTGQSNISAWILMLRSFALMLPVMPNLRIARGTTDMLHLANGADTATDIYLGRASQDLIASVYQLP